MASLSATPGDAIVATTRTTATAGKKSGYVTFAIAALMGARVWLSYLLARANMQANMCRLTLLSCL
jgi:hypothetical protein